MDRRRFPIMLIAGLAACSGGANTCQSTEPVGGPGSASGEHSSVSGPGASSSKDLSVGGPGAASRKEPTPGPRGAASAQPLLCNTDADCPSLACGPCTPGEVITSDRARINCTVNPCLGARAVCGPAGDCVVNAGARKSPMVWCRKCWELERAARQLCDAKPQAEKPACQRTLSDAVAKCSDVECEAARSGLAR